MCLVKNRPFTFSQLLSISLTMSSDPSMNEQCKKATEDVASQNTMYQILTGVFGGLALILMIVTIWVLAARKSGHSAPIPAIQGGFSLGSLGSLMSTS